MNATIEPKTEQRPVDKEIVVFIKGIPPFYPPPGLARQLRDCAQRGIDADQKKAEAATK